MHNIAQAQVLLHDEETDVFSDNEYQGVEKREEKLELPVKGQIAHFRLNIFSKPGATTEISGAGLQSYSSTIPDNFSNFRKIHHKIIGNLLVGITTCCMSRNNFIMWQNEIQLPTVFHIGPYF